MEEQKREYVAGEKERRKGSKEWDNRGRGRGVTERGISPGLCNETLKDGAV